MTRRPRRAVPAAAALAAAAAVLAGCGPADGGGRAAARMDGGPARISVTGAYIPLPPSPSVAAGYLVLHNAGGTADRLLGVTSPAARSVTMHRSTAGSMLPLDGLDVPAHGTAAFSRGGDHLMITGLDRRPALGDRVELDLTFARTGTVSVQVPVEPLTYRPPGAAAGAGG
ncbi:copper chaperone PCu(A)C [Streptomyces sp. NPDC001380]|uniref:copper chaperone PCu(A)C n=1 Tax=Streptomyces sp. NPDC001380 TaxID=3364566 RepID=UPI00369C511C